MFKIIFYSFIFTLLFVVNHTKIQDEAERFFTIDENGNLLEAKETVYAENYKILTPPNKNTGSSLVIHSIPTNKTIEESSKGTSSKGTSSKGTSSKGTSSKESAQSIDLPKTFLKLNSFNEAKGKKVLHKNIIAVHLIKNALNYKLKDKINIEYSKTLLPSNKQKSDVIPLQKINITSNRKRIYNPISLKPANLELNLKKNSSNLSTNNSRGHKASSINNKTVLEEEKSKNILNKTKESYNVEAKTSKINETKKYHFEDTKNSINAKNMLTNSTMKGYLSKNSNFTINKIGISYNNEEKENNSSSSKRKLEQNKEILQNSTSSSYLLPSKNLIYTNQTINSSEIGSPRENVFPKSRSLHLADTTEFVKIISDQPKYEKFTDLKALKKTNIVECTSSSMCPSDKYCSNLLCYDCQKTKHACVEDEHCCKGLSCIYGRCDNKAKGSPVYT